MRTPSLRRRVLASGLIVLAVVIISLEVFVLVNLQQGLETTLAEVLEARVEVAREVARTEDPADVPARLTALGVPAVVTSATGEIIETLPVIPRFGPGPPGPVGAVAGPWESQTVALPGGGHIEVQATRARVEATMRRARLLMAIGTLVAVAVGWWALRWTTAEAMAPLSEVAAAARRTASGVTGERLEADQTDTELGRLAVAYDEMLDELEDAVARAVDAEERTRRFLDDAAHQLRTPLAGIRASVESMLSVNDAVERDRLMSNLVRETARAGRVLRDLLLMARLDAGRPPQRTPTDVMALVEDEADRTHSLAPHLEVLCESRGPLGPITVDPTAVREIVANLLDNARRHARTQVRVRVEVTAGSLRTRVDDDGPGVAPEARELVFERFATLDGHGGSGLGLPIARALAERHGGRLTCDGDGFELWRPTTSGADAHEPGSDAHEPAPDAPDQGQAHTAD
jgi:two-component system, OmpR family, sensor kinase